LADKKPPEFVAKGEEKTLPEDLRRLMREALGSRLYEAVTGSETFKIFIELGLEAAQNEGSFPTSAWQMVLGYGIIRTLLLEKDLKEHIKNSETRFFDTLHQVSSLIVSPGLAALSTEERELTRIEARASVMCLEPGVDYINNVNDPYARASLIYYLALHDLSVALSGDNSNSGVSKAVDLLRGPARVI
ncbi:MAG TPA: hypothetical protein PLF29_02460, partial [bacterium]|nr:hypothetical protein [bacterium]